MTYLAKGKKIPISSAHSLYSLLLIWGYQIEPFLLPSKTSYNCFQTPTPKFQDPET